MSEKKERKKYLCLRLSAMALFIITTILLVSYTPIGDWLSLSNMQFMVEQSGIWGVLIFIAIFVAAAIMNVPGTAFLLLAILLFGYWQGAVFAYIGAMIGAWATFVIGRFMGGKALSEIKNPTIRNLLNEAEERPVRTLIILRVLLQFSPLIGYTLALTNIKQKNYIIGNLVGILIPTVGISIGMYFFEDAIRALFG
jgi:uncharacterized membrane protein YdjX (TVP38/TMEM64 family)